MDWVLAPLLLLLLLLLPGGSSSPVVHAVDHDGDDYYTIVAMSSLRPEAACLGHRAIPPHNGTWVPLHHPLGPCSPSLSSGTPTKPQPSLGDLLRQDQSRVDHIHGRLSEDVGDNKGITKTMAPSQSFQIMGQLATNVNVGNQQQQQSIGGLAATGGGRRSRLPGVIQTLVLDTASDVPWVQCVPCPIPPCHPQTNTFYDPTKSPTYAAFRCNSPACTGLGPYANGCVNNQCQYRVRYPDGSSSSGTYVSDLLTINPTNSISNFQFGCSHAEQGSFNNRAAGIMALGGGPESLVSQAASIYGNAFSYCGPPTESHKGFFLLGVPRVAASRYVVTPMLRYKQVPTFYRVLLRDIIVAGKRLNVAPSVFAAGSVMDSRTIITRLPATAYQALRAAFRNSMGMYRSAPSKGNLDTCYDFTGVATVRLPRIALVFDQNAAVELDPSAVLFNDCLAFIPNRDDRMAGILGNVQQRTIEVFYDVAGGAVGFRRNAC
ncbi:Aspartyl protease family protein [Dichanthelium oligosanthes]|uniref:Aspartyl protease family protein n=1 Tax=Dichanthelium oligosanthes TaxID=888268 RepID=A0A1E5WL15_9POAL|nr:Aspartyl protease family protein [Dichanthelium oligosanthes]